jgi:hypothetical protein
MKLLNLKNKYRVVHWHGFTLYIPHDHCYVAADSRGEVYSYGEKPFLESTMYGDCWLAEKPCHALVAMVDLEGLAPGTTLVEYPL